MKEFLKKNYAFRIYCVRGNHEARPQNIPDMKLVYDPDVHGEVYMQEDWPNIRYFKDFGLYMIDGLEIAIVGGAYSVDKWYRLANNYIWFEDEQLSDEEMLSCTAEFTGVEVDMVLTHTCPVCWEPSDLFLRGIDQSKVDKSMELFLEELATCFGWHVWCFGHYHADRLERQGVEQFYRDTEELRTVWDRWVQYDKTKELDWWLDKSPNFEVSDRVLEERDRYWNDESN